jgi:hypothetical protein
MNRIQALSLAINSPGILVKYSYGTRVIVGNKPCGAGDGIIVRTGLSGDGGDLTHRARTALGSAGWLCCHHGMYQRFCWWGLRDLTADRLQFLGRHISVKRAINVTIMI